jgi:hypothetical protein
MATTKDSAAAEEVRQASLAQQIADLEVGKTVSQAERLDGDEATKEVIQETITRLRNLISPAVARAKKRSGGEYTVEVGKFDTRSLDIIVVAAITRTA